MTPLIILNEKFSIYYMISFIDHKDIVNGEVIHSVTFFVEYNSYF